MRPIVVGTWTMLLLMTTGCADKEPPAWPDGATLEAPEIGDTWVRLAWRAARDDEGVVAYLLKHGDDQPVEVAASETKYRAVGLKDASEHRFSVQARDQAGNVSSPIVGTVTTRDGTPPSWGRQTSVRAEALKIEKAGTLVKLYWAPATDNVAVTGYRILRDKEPIQELGPETQSHVFAIGELSTNYLLEARDETGNWSAGIPFDLDQVRRERRRIEIQRSLCGKGLLSILGSKGGSVNGPTVESVFGSGSHLTIDNALGGLAGVDAGNYGVRSGHGSGGGGTGAAIGLGSMGTGTGVLETEKVEKNEQKAVVRLASVSTSGKELPADPVRAFLRERKPALGRCYQHGLERDAKLTGNRTFTLSLSDGQVAKAVPVGRAADDAMDRCLIRQLIKLKIPGANGQATVMLSFSRE